MFIVSHTQNYDVSAVDLLGIVPTSEKLPSSGQAFWPCDPCREIDP